MEDRQLGSRLHGEPAGLVEGLRVGLVLRRAGDHDVEAGERSRFEQRVGDVVAAVADEREPPAFQVAEDLRDRQHVCECLARVVLVRERVHHRHRRPACELVDRLLRERADDDRRAVAGERSGGVGDRLAAPELQLLRRQRHRRCTETRGSRGERDAGSRRRLVEDAGDRLPVQRALAVVRLRPKRLGEREQLGERVGCEIGDAGEVARVNGVGALGAHTPARRDRRHLDHPTTVSG